MRTIRVSEISSYTYCQRAWWYQVNGEVSANQPEMTDGVALHERHGRKVYLAGCLRVLAYVLLLLALVILAVVITFQLL